MVKTLIQVNMTHGTAKQPLINAIAEMRDFHTRRGTRSGRIMAQGYSSTCNSCRTFTEYLVWSYDTLIFSYCPKCKTFTFNRRWYSKTTLTIQKSIIAAFSDLKLEMLPKGQ